MIPSHKKGKLQGLGIEVGVRFPGRRGEVRKKEKKGQRRGEMGGKEVKGERERRRGWVSLLSAFGR